MIAKLAEAGDDERAFVPTMHLSIAKLAGLRADDAAFDRDYLRGRRRAGLCADDAAFDRDYLCACLGIKMGTEGDAIIVCGAPRTTS